MSSASPAADGYRWPAEWESHTATWLVWPHKEDSWPGKLERIPPVFVEMVRALVEGERVVIAVQTADERNQVNRVLQGAGVAMDDVDLWILPTDDAWIRDHGPIFVTREGAAPLAAIDWDYNAWGGKYPPWDRDAEVARRIAEQLDVPRFQPGMVLEGGSIDGDGQGTLLTTESCLLHPNRNPELGRTDIEKNLRLHLGAEKILWLGAGITGDDTDGHVDDLARFVAPGKVVAVVSTDESDPDFMPLEENRRRLESMRDARGRAIEVYPLPTPRPVWEGGDRLPASYANFYIANAVVLVPTFDDPSDAHALDLLQACFPQRRVVGIDARDLVLGLGAFHCLTQQQPAPSDPPALRED